MQLQTKQLHIQYIYSNLLCQKLFVRICSTTSFLWDLSAFNCRQSSLGFRLILRVCRRGFVSGLNRSAAVALAPTVATVRIVLATVIIWENKSCVVAQTA